MCRPGYDYMDLFPSDLKHPQERYDRREYNGLNRKTELEGKTINETWDVKLGKWIKREV